MSNDYTLLSNKTGVLFRGEHWIRTYAAPQKKYSTTICWEEVRGEQKFTYDEDGGDGWMYRRYTSFYPECCELPLIEQEYQKSLGNLTKKGTWTPSRIQPPTEKRKQMILTARIGDDDEYWYEATNWNHDVDCEGLTITYLERDEAIGIKDCAHMTLNREEALELAAAIRLFFGGNDAT